jgi:hypothetical protein
MPRRTQTKKTAPKKVAPKTIVPMKKNNDMRFSLSLVILIGMLTFSVLLLLVTLSRPSAMDAKAMYAPVQRTPKIQNSKMGASGQILEDNGIDFKLSVPGQLGKWFYRIGEVKSLTDDSLSDRYLKMYIPLSSTKSNNFNEQNQDILTVRRLTVDEWSDIEKSCKDGEQSVCSAGGRKIDLGNGSASEKWVYAYTKADNCPKNIASKCALADTIIKSFKLK